MNAYNLLDLETTIQGDGWTVSAADFVTPQNTPGLVHDGGYSVTVTSPAGDPFTGTGATRPDAFRHAAEAAGLIDESSPITLR